MDDFIRDARIGLRRLARRPGFAAVAVGMLALGLSASTAVYTYIDAFFQPFPGADAADVLRVHRVTGETAFGELSYPDYLDLVDFGAGAFAGVEGVSYGFGASVRHEDFAEIVFGGAVTIDPFAAVPRLEEEYRAVDPRLAVVNVVPYDEVLSGFLYTQRMNAELFSIVAVLALVLAAVGIYGVMNLAVGMRTREIGIRMAIGAARGDITRLVVLRVVAAVSVGMSLGLVGSLVATRWTESMLYGVTPLDLPSFVVASVTLAAAAFVAAWVPTRRALTVHPMQSLRIE